MRTPRPKSRSSVPAKKKLKCAYCRDTKVVSRFKEGGEVKNSDGVIINQEQEQIPCPYCAGGVALATGPTASTSIEGSASIVEVHRKGFEQIPHSVIFDETISPEARCLYMVLKAHYNKNAGKAWPSHRKLAKILGLRDRHAVQRLVEELEDGRYIETKRHRRSNMDYYFQDDKMAAKPAIKKPQDSEKALDGSEKTLDGSPDNLLMVEKPATNYTYVSRPRESIPNSTLYNTLPIRNTKRSPQGSDTKSLLKKANDEADAAIARLSEAERKSLEERATQEVDDTQGSQFLNPSARQSAIGAKMRELLKTIK